MAKEADYQGDDVVIISRNPLKGKLLLLSALGAFLMEGVIGPL